MKWVGILMLFPVLAFGQLATLPGSGIAMYKAPVVASTPWAPTNYYAYYNADDITASDGSAVTLWNDAGANINLYVIGADSGKAPYFTNSDASFGNKKAVVWTGLTIRALTNAFGSTKNQPFTIFAVYRHIGAAADGEKLIDSTVSSPRMQIAFDSSPLLYVDAGNVSATMPDAIPQAAVVYTFYLNNGSTYVRTNGVSWKGTGTFIGTDGSPGFTIGANYAGSATVSHFSLRRLLIYNATMADGDRNWVESNIGQ